MSAPRTADDRLASSLIRHARRLSRAVGAMAFSPPVAFVLNPLDYARHPHEQYLRTFGRAGIEALFLGMNPGPFGMAQTGVPFGDVAMVRGFLGIDAPVATAVTSHPRRPILGFDCPRREVSGTRFWSWARDRFGTADAFFDRCFVWNHCPLAFMEESGRNLTPDRLPAASRDALDAACDEALRSIIRTLAPSRIIGVGDHAAKAAERACASMPVRVDRILHPSPASPAANRGWAEAAEAQLRAAGFRIPAVIRATPRAGARASAPAEPAAVGPDPGRSARVRGRSRASRPT